MSLRFVFPGQGSKTCHETTLFPVHLRLQRRYRQVAMLGHIVAGLAAIGILYPPVLSAQDREPIAYVGHGAFFDHSGRQIAVTLDFVAKAQEWYRTRLIEGLSAAKKREFTAFDRRLKSGLNVEGQDALVLQHQSLEWLIANTPSNSLKLQTAGKLRALRNELNWKLSDEADLKILDKREPFTPKPEVSKRLAATPLKPIVVQPRGGAGPLRITGNSGQAYIDECVAAGVPLPPPINQMDPAGITGWKSQGFIPQATQFIVGTPAELRSFQKTIAPEGMCFALPRYSDAGLGTVSLDGVICMSKQTSKVCFWDNQWTNPATGNVETFPFSANTQIPIGVPATVGAKYQAGGKEIEFGPGGICTDCHAGENPYIIHPKANLATSGPAVLWETLSTAPQNLPTMPPNRYDPIVAATWPQNQLSQAGPTVPGACRGCHTKAGTGRFPHLSNQLPGYCDRVLAQAITRTMPPSAPGSEAAVANDFMNTWCSVPPNMSSADSGDPHITTTNGINYDFQAAGEFTALRNSDNGFELQTRQSPVLTNFNPGPNAYTGLSSCVSLNTAVALRVGKRRITYQRSGVGKGDDRLQLRIDGEPAKVARSLDLGEGNVIRRGAGNGDLDMRLADGTRVVVIPLFWASQGYWYLDVQVFHSPAREGIMGPILAGDWLPRGPDGSSFGPKPTALNDRHTLLNQKFAKAWRVTDATSLFDYAPGTTTADFVDLNWPTPSGNACTSTTIRGQNPRVKEARPDLAKRACRGIRDKTVLQNCLFDVTVMGDATVAKGHLQVDQLKAAAVK